MLRPHNDVRLEQMSLEQKASLMSGANFWNTKALPHIDLPSMMLTDGPHGLRKQAGAADHLGLNASVPATCFPTAATLANSWDTSLIRQVGAAIGKEAAAENVRVVLGPGMNIKRNPLAGRNFEYFSEDPLLSGELAAELVDGIQSNGVGASVKHFAVNSQETHRMAINEIVDERSLHEIYLEGFRIAIQKSAPWTVMSSYNRVNGIFANEHPYLLNEVLRERWGYNGLVVSDWGGNVDRVASIKAGGTLEMPSTSGVSDQEVVAAVNAGALSMEDLDARVMEILTLADRSTPEPGIKVSVDLQEHHELAVEAARQTVVLLQNNEHALPLTTDAGRIAVIGDFAATPRYQGAGSSLVNPTRVDDALTALKNSGLNIIGFERGFTRRDSKAAGMAHNAVELAQQADTVLLFLGLDESAEAEGIDRTHMRLARNQLNLARQLSKLDKRVVVVLVGGSPVELPFAGSVDAIIHGYLGGQGGGRGLVDVLTGKVDATGRLAETYPLVYEDVPSSRDFGHTQATSEHREGIFVGYRYFDKVDAPVRFPFGFGLSYTTFAYSDLEASTQGAQVTVTNTGDRAGVETVQLYVEAPNKATGQIRAVRELRAYTKVALEPGESARVTLGYSQHTFGAYDVESKGWKVYGGTYTVQVGSHSRNILAQATVEAEGPEFPQAPSALLHYATGAVSQVKAAEFEALLGHKLPNPHWDKNAPLTRNDLISQAKGRGGFGGFLYGAINDVSSFHMLIGKPIASNNTKFVLELPFRSVSRMSGGKANDAMVDAMLVMANGQFFKGAKEFIAAWRLHVKSAKKRRKA